MIKQHINPIGYCDQKIVSKHRICNMPHTPEIPVSGAPTPSYVVIVHVVSVKVSEDFVLLTLN